MTCNKHFFILKDRPKDESDEHLQIITLRNPATGKPTKYLLRNDDRDLYEMNCFSESNRSWFINETVCSNGKIFLPTLVDPLFLAIPYLEKNCTGKAVPLDHVFVDDEFPHTGKLVRTLSGTDQLALIADEKRAGDIRAYKYNEEKVLDWLRRKCVRLEQALGKERKFSRSHNFVKKEEKENERQEGEMLAYAHGIISDYLSLELSRKLTAVIELPDEKVLNKRKSTTELDVSQIKKLKKEEVHETTPVKPPPEKKESDFENHEGPSVATPTSSRNGQSPQLHIPTDDDITLVALQVTQVALSKMHALQNDRFQPFGNYVAAELRDIPDRKAADRIQRELTRLLLDRLDELDQEESGEFS